MFSHGISKGKSKSRVGPPVRSTEKATSGIRLVEGRPSLSTYMSSQHPSVYALNWKRRQRNVEGKTELS